MTHDPSAEDAETVVAALRASADCARPAQALRMLQATLPENTDCSRVTSGLLTHLRCGEARPTKRRHSAGDQACGRGHARGIL